MTVQYIHLTYEAYKSLECQMKAFHETTHRSEGGFYHKSIRLKIDEHLTMEFHAPLVGGYGHNEAQQPDRAQTTLRVLMDDAAEPPHGEVTLPLDTDR